MSKLSLLCGPPDSPHFENILNRFQSCLVDGPVGSALWLSPTKRALDSVKQILFAKLSSVLCPQLFTFDDFTDEIVRQNAPHAQPISHLHRRLLIEQLVSWLHKDNKLSHFGGVIDTRGLGETLFSFVTELRQRDISPISFSQAVDQRTSVPRQTMEKDKQCALIYHVYEDLLKENQLWDAESRATLACELLKKKLHPFEKVRQIFVHGFTGFSNAQREILQHMSSQAEIVITLPEEKDDRQDLFASVRNTVAIFTDLSPNIQYCQSASEVPIGLSKLRGDIFRPLRVKERHTDASGLSLIEAPGDVGEVRMVARHIKQLLLSNTNPSDILVVQRDVEPTADLIREVFAEYHIPFDIEGADSLIRNPVISLLLRVLRIPDDSFVFPQVSALLRSSYFHPAWPEVDQAPNVLGKSEALLRMLQEPRDRNAYLSAVVRWAENPPPGLEDEAAEESRRIKIHELAKECRKFLEKFFRSWDEAPEKATLHKHIIWLQHLADMFGISRAAKESEIDQLYLQTFLSELKHWQQLDRKINGSGNLIDRFTFHRLLIAMTEEAGLARTPRGHEKVQVVSAPLARALSADHVFLMGLSERSFPKLALPESIFDEQERQAYKQSGLELTTLNELLPKEMFLFYQILQCAKKTVTFSYPAVDERGQDLLPSSFLTSVLDCFAENSIPRERRSMLIEGYDRDVPLSLPEYRVQAAIAMNRGAEKLSLPAHLSSQLSATRELIRERFESEDFTTYDGMLQNRELIKSVREKFGPEKILSPTALESYISCPFKFFFNNILKLQPLEEPSDEIESTDRGLAFHRALSRLHTDLKEQDRHLPDASVGDDLIRQLEIAVSESKRQTSPAGRMLWELEGERLKQMANRYSKHWNKFVEPWLVHKVEPRPEYFEVGFGLPEINEADENPPLIIEHDTLEVRISGRIDRVDVAELMDGTIAFWIIDYKTGRSTYYTSKDTGEFRKLQLTLYALAVENVMLAKHKARPLGMAYWLVTDTGPKIVLPIGRKVDTWYEKKDVWPELRQKLQQWVIELVSRIRNGQFPLKPRSDHCTVTCDFGEVCRISQSRTIVESKGWKLELPVVS